MPFSHGLCFALAYSTNTNITSVYHVPPFSHLHTITLCCTPIFMIRSKFNKIALNYCVIICTSNMKQCQISILYFRHATLIRVGRQFFLRTEFANRIFLKQLPCFLFGLRTDQWSFLVNEWASKAILTREHKPLIRLCLVHFLLAAIYL